MKIQIAGFWVMTQCGLICDCRGKYILRFQKDILLSHYAERDTAEYNRVKAGKAT